MLVLSIFLREENQLNALFFFMQLSETHTKVYEAQTDFSALV